MNDDDGNVLINSFFEELDNVRVVRVLGFSLCENLKRGHWFRGPEENCKPLVFCDVPLMMIMETYLLTLYSKNQTMSALSAF